MTPKNHFVKDATPYDLKKEIHQLKDSGVIVSIDREYDSHKGFQDRLINVIKKMSG